MKMKILESIGALVIALFGVLLVALIYGAFVVFLWNWLVPDIFGLPAIGFWQAYGLTVLCSVLFKNSNSSK